MNLFNNLKRSFKLLSRLYIFWVVKKVIIESMGVLKRINFLFSDSECERTYGLTVGSIIFPILYNIKMSQRIEDRDLVFKKFLMYKFRICLLYADDIFVYKVSVVHTYLTFPILLILAFSLLIEVIIFSFLMFWIQKILQISSFLCFENPVPSVFLLVLNIIILGKKKFVFQSYVYFIVKLS